MKNSILETAAWYLKRISRVLVFNQIVISKPLLSTQSSEWNLEEKSVKMK